MKLFALYLLAVNALAFLAFALDKAKARKGRRRIPEKSLLLLSALGGSPGALLAMRLFHHKTRKKAFALGIPLMLTAQALLLAYWIFKLRG